jgi:hypothetical protein
MSYINHNSFVLVAGASTLLLAFFLLRDGIESRDLIAITALALGFTLAFFLLRPGPSTTNEASRVIAQIGAGKPVLLEFQSNF